MPKMNKMRRKCPYVNQNCIGCPSHVDIMLLTTLWKLCKTLEIRAFFHVDRLCIIVPRPP